MSYEINEKEIASVVSLPLAARLKYMVKRVAWYGTSWALESSTGGLAVAVGGDGNEYLMLWPHEAFASLYAQQGDWADQSPTPIDLEELEEILEDLSPGRKIAAFPVPGGQGVVFKPEELWGAIKQELDQSEPDEGE